MLLKGSKVEKSHFLTGCMHFSPVRYYTLITDNQNEKWMWASCDFQPTISRVTQAFNNEVCYLTGIQWCLFLSCAVTDPTLSLLQLAQCTISKISTEVCLIRLTAQPLCLFIQKCFQWGFLPDKFAQECSQRAKLDVTLIMSFSFAFFFFLNKKLWGEWSEPGPGRDEMRGVFSESCVCFLKRGTISFYTLQFTTKNQKASMIWQINHIETSFKHKCLSTLPNNGSQAPGKGLHML